MTAQQRPRGDDAAMTVPADAAPEDSAVIAAATEARHAFARDLTAFHIRSGKPSYKQIVKTATRYRVTPSGITDMLSGNRLLPRDFVIAFVRAVEELSTGLPSSPQSDALVEHWRDRWVSAKSLEQAARAPRKRVIDALIQQARNEAAEMRAAARREVEAALAAAGNHHVRHTRAKQLQEERLRQAQEAAEKLLSDAQQRAHSILHEAQHEKDRATRMVRSLEERATHLSDEVERLKAEAARLVVAKEENPIEVARLATPAGQETADAVRFNTRSIKGGTSWKRINSSLLRPRRVRPILRRVRKPLGHLPPPGYHKKG
ncbi:DivIVA domain-containing protein [Streptomyces griseobrunneus]